MTYAICADKAEGRLAIWEIPPTGDKMDPFNDPVAHFQYIRFCSDFQYLSIHDAKTAVINHTSLAGVTGTGYTVGNGTTSTSSSPISNGQIRTTSIKLCDHDLGYAPLVFVLNDGRLVAPGTMLQTENSGNRIRQASIYATSTSIYLKETAISDASALSAIDLTYDILIFKDPEADPAQPFLKIDPADEIVLAWGKITDSDLPIRRAIPGDATFYIPTARTIDIRNGAVRNISPISGVKDWGQYFGGFFEASAIQVTY